MSALLTKVLAEGDDIILAQLRTLDKKVQTKTVRKATNAAGKVVLKATQANARAIKQTGFTARSLKSVTKSRKGTTTVRVGQQKQKKFKARKSNRAGGRNLSQIQREGKPVPIHFIELGTKPHIIRAAAGKRLVFVGKGRKTKRNRNLIFARVVRNPGSKPRLIMRASARQSQRPASAAFTAIVRTELASV